MYKNSKADETLGHQGHTLTPPPIHSFFPRVGRESFVELKTEVAHYRSATQSGIR